MTLSMATSLNDDPITRHHSNTNTKQQQQETQQQSSDYATKTTTTNATNKEETDAAVSQLLARLDEGTQTIANLRSILTLKTAELSELMSQLEMTHQAISHVESTTGHIETMLKDLGLTHNQNTTPNIDTTKDLLISAEASLDSAIQSALHLSSAGQQKQKRPLSTSSSNGGGNYNTIRTQPSQQLQHQQQQQQQQQQPHPRFVSRIRYKPDTKHLLRQLTDRLRDLELDAGKFFETIGSTTDVPALQKAYVDLDLAETIALSAKSNLKRRKILLTSSRRRQGLDQVTLLGDKIREGVDMWKTYTRNAPMKVNGEDILVILKLQDQLLDKQGPSTPTRMSMDMKRANSPTQSNSSSSSSSRPWRQTMSPSTSGTTTTVPTARKHRSASISSVSSIPMPAAQALPPPPPLPANMMKKSSSPAYRHSTNATSSYHHHRTPQIKANVGVSRVRTSSLTHKNKDIATTSPPITPANATANATATSTSTSTSDLPPPPVKSNLKLPTQRGPGSTLRIRSMLARRNPTPLTTPP
ncbi:hypothetical protein BCR42DRAFT_427359 [Absidia repens]|uniref:Uncharacterized protein n=1 Tax=Absidia repens TaxID=90262 RepID=A0A1X2HZS2_9FUNG|nr:hypothetical protein BCR42DRAFT_427359 [Absidia repens]